MAHLLEPMLSEWPLLHLEITGNTVQDDASMSSVNGAEKLGQCGGRIVYHRLVTDGS